MELPGTTRRGGHTAHADRLDGKILRGHQGLCGHDHLPRLRSAVSAGVSRDGSRRPVDLGVDHLLDVRAAHIHAVSVVVRRAWCETMDSLYIRARGGRWTSVSNPAAFGTGPGAFGRGWDGVPVAGDLDYELPDKRVVELGAGILSVVCHPAHGFPPRPATTAARRDAGRVGPRVPLGSARAGDVP